MKCKRISKTRQITVAGELIQIQEDIWIITDKEGKYLGAVLLELPLNRGEFTYVHCELNNIKSFFVCFEIIREYPQNLFEIQIPIAQENEAFKKIVEEKKLLFKEYTESHMVYQYVNKRN